MLRLTIFAALLSVWWPASATAEENNGNTLEAVATAKVKVKPDAARVSFAVLTGMATIKEVREENSKMVKNVADAITALKLAGIEMKVIHGDLNVVYATPARGVIGDLNPSIVGYRLLTTFTVVCSEKVTDKLRGLANRILDTAIENGANAGGIMPAATTSTPSAPMIEYFAKDITEAKRQAIATATANALAENKALASGAGIANYQTTAVSIVSESARTSVRDVLNDPFGELVFGAARGGSVAGRGAACPDEGIELVVRVSVRCKF